jgi:hypothetical protein
MATQVIPAGTWILENKYASYLSLRHVSVHYTQLKTPDKTSLQL